jgi:hypothetical protein
MPVGDDSAADQGGISKQASHDGFSLRRVYGDIFGDFHWIEAL